MRRYEEETFYLSYLFTSVLSILYIKKEKEEEEKRIRIRINAQYGHGRKTKK